MRFERDLRRALNRPSIAGEKSETVEVNQMAARKAMVLLSAIAAVAAGCGGGGGGGGGDGGGSPTQPGGGSGANTASYELSGGYTAKFSGPLLSDDGTELYYDYTVETVTIDFPSIEEEDCTFGETVVSQETRDELLALTEASDVERQVSLIIRDSEGTGSIRTRSPTGTAPHVGLCWSTKLGFCPYTFVGTDIDDPTTRREFRFAGGGNNAVRLLVTEVVSGKFTGHEAICMNDDPVTVVVGPAQ